MIDFDPNNSAPETSGLFALPYNVDNASLVIVPVPWDATSSQARASSGAPDAIYAASTSCIPEDVMLDVHAAVLRFWQKAESQNRRYFHWEYFYQLIRSGFFDERHDVPLEDSWVIAA